MNCAADWFGFASGDLPNVASVLVDLSNFPVIPDGSQQGMVNQMFLARLLTHPDGFAANPLFQVAGQPVFDRREVFYHGNSQGGILGGVLVAASKDINRGVLGVIGMNYSTLLTRSTDFTLYSIPLYLSYTDDLDRALNFALMQMLWDRSENNGYAGHIADNGAMGGPDNAVLLHPAFGDHQVTMYSADVMARTIGAPVDRRRVAADRHPDIVEYFGLQPMDYVNAAQTGGSALVYWDEPWNSQLSGTCDNYHTAPPPVGNLPPGTPPPTCRCSAPRAPAVLRSAASCASRSRAPVCTRSPCAPRGLPRTPRARCPACGARARAQRVASAAPSTAAVDRDRGGPPRASASRCSGRRPCPSRR